MADDNQSRYRPSDPFGRGPAQAAPASDPLAELARLIGQSDPFAEFGRDQRPQAEHDSAPRYPSEPAPQYGNEAPPRYDEPAPAYGNDSPRYNNDSAPRFAREFPPRYADERQLPPDAWPGDPVPPRSFAPPDPFALPSQAQEPMPAPPPYDPQAYAEPRALPGFDNYAPEVPGFERPGLDRQGLEPPGFPSARAEQPFPPPVYPHEPEAGSMPPPHGDDFYDDAPRGGRRKGLLTVAAVLGLAVIGTAGAFGYRSFFGGAGSSGPPPVIRASGEPSKVAPPPSKTDPAASKFSYDRFGDRGKDEQVVTREEKPVDPKELARSSVPRTVLPGAPSAGTAIGRPPSAGTTATANPPSAIGEPRRVRTVPIKPDQQDIAASSPVAPEPAPQSRQASNNANAAAVPPANRPTDLSPPQAAPAARAPAPRTPSRVVATRSAPPAAPTTAGNAPLSLSPDAGNAELPPPVAARDIAPPPPPRATSAPTRIASAPASGGNGRYLVQVSSQRSQADAESSFRNLQSKYSGVLSGQPHVVRRADLGSKGVYYRAMVGPFGSRDEAIRLCSSLKSAGGDCVVQSN